MLCELYFDGEYLRRAEKYTLEWSKNLIPTIYPQKPLSKPSSLPTEQTTCSLTRKSSFPNDLSAFQQRNIIRNFQYLSESIAPAGFQFKN